MNESQSQATVLAEPQVSGSHDGATRQSLLVWRTISPLLLFIGIGGFLFWGHHTGWTFPKLSALVSRTKEPKRDWCDEHSVPESQCVECNPALLPKQMVFGWCKLHGIHECPLCHPEVAEIDPQPKITAPDLERANRALTFSERPENNSKCKLHEHRIQFISQEAVEKAGIEVEPVWTAPMTETVTGNGEITYDQTKTARLSSRVPGTLFRAFKQIGDRVQEGEVVALVDAADVGRAKSEYLQAQAHLRLKTKNFEMLERFHATKNIPEVEFREAETGLSEARIRLMTARHALINLGLMDGTEDLSLASDDQLAARLRFLGIPKTVVESLEGKRPTGNLLPIVAPFAGIVVARDVVAGEVVDNTKVLFVVVDPRQLWLTIDLRLEDAKKVRLGQKVHFRPDGESGDAVGSINWISTEVDHKTRTIKVRALLDNDDGHLRANTFGLGRIVLREEKNAIVVPGDAVQSEGCCHVLFVRDRHFLKEGSPKIFHVREVRFGVKGEQNTEVVAGVLPGEIVATKGSGILRAELLKHNLGEG
jgi:membrane fusion protein, heavy metal efflux system